MKLLNLMEQVVGQAIDDIKNYYDFCDCPVCRNDITAMSLNKLPPRYVVTERGESYSRAEMLAMQESLDVVSVVMAAIKKVEQNPRH